MQADVHQVTQDVNPLPSSLPLWLCVLYGSLLLSVIGRASS